MAKSSQSLYHIGLRYAALASKPGLIWFLVASGASGAAVEIGSLALVASLIGLAMGNESHLQLYTAHFSEQHQSSRTLFRHLLRYHQALMTHVILIAGPALLVCVALFPKVNPFLALVLGLAERVSDELLRFLLYRKEWNRWTAWLLAKSVVPAAAALVALMFKGAVGLAFTLASILFAGALIAGSGRAVHKALVLAIRKLPDLRFIRSYLLIYARVLFPRQAAAILGLNVILLDRYIGMNVWNQHDLAYLLLAGQIISGVFFVVEAKFLSEHRANFINQAMTLARFWRWRPYILLLALCLLACGAGFSVGTILGLLPSVRQELYVAAALLAINCCLFYITIPLNDYLYYRGQAARLALAHAALFSVYVLLVAGVEDLQTPAIALSMLMAVLLIRLSWLASVRRGLDRRSALET